MTWEQNTRLAKLIQYLSYDFKEEFDAKVIYRRIVAVIGINGLLALFSKCKPARERLRSLLDGLPLVLAVPSIRRITGQRNTSWILGLSIGVSKLRTRLPNWIVAYWLIESIVDVAKTGISYEIMSERHWIILRQALASVLISTFFHRNSSRGRLFRILFEKRKPWKDFLLLFAAWNLGKVYQSAKHILLKEKIENQKSDHLSVAINVETKEMQSHQSSMTQLLIKRLEELNELSNKNSRASLKERFYGFIFGDNFMKCLKWTIWRQLVAIVYNGKHGKCLKPFHKSVMIMLTFTVLNGTEPLNVNWAIVKYLGRSTLAEELNRLPSYQKPVIFGALNLAYFTRNIMQNDTK